MSVQIKLAALAGVPNSLMLAIQPMWTALNQAIQVLNGGGYSGTFIDQTGKTVTVVNGVISSVK